MILVGVDVGGPAKGYHAVALADRTIVAKFASRGAPEIAVWCNEQKATIVAIDAPCRWRVDGRPARAAERELAAERISCFSTPTENKARGHAFYTWMFAGMELYAALANTHPIWSGAGVSAGVAIEAFPQAVACALAGEVVSAKQKFSVRTALLRRAGVDVSAVANIDEVDAALCALAAQAFANGEAKSYGDALGGFIVVPKQLPGELMDMDSKPPARGRSKPNRSGSSLATILELLPSLTTADRLQLASRLEDRSRPI